ncbi:MAG: hypothetical protein A2534_02455 [Candidatus Magasanikbacteria bacterium RIFOXYD2_FULL_39_9]|nr:MAG: hypothetical protein A2534_02455 [Candidatus Magasanikbacteria bacterium RIFOXYD2_FULL_39_9]
MPNNYKTTKKLTALVFFLLVFSFFFRSSLAQAQGSEETNYGQQNILFWEFDLKAKKPLLEIDIPGLHFSNVVSTSNELGTYYYIPWIPELISALYNFSIGIVSIVAVIMIIVQGVHIIASRGGEGKSASYKKIGQALIGLLIAWGSFAILYNINPATTEFNALKVKTVDRLDLKDIVEMQITTAETISPEDANGTMQSSLPNESEGIVPRFENCPITLESPIGKSLGNAGKEKRTLEFYDKVGSIVNMSEPLPTRIIKVADAATKCGVRFGSCGRTAGTIYTLAGIGTRACLTAKDNRGCWTHEKADSIFRQAKISTPSHKLCADLCKYAKTKEEKTSCWKLQKAATQAVNQVYLQNSTLIKKGWPDDVANLLKQGDVIWIFNSNGEDCYGQHSALFDKWAPDGINAQVIQGQQGGIVKYGYICLKKQCGDKMKPITAIFRPK